MDEFAALVKDLKDMLLGIALMVFALGVLGFGYLWTQGASGFVVFFYGGLLLFVIGAICTWDSWHRRRSQKPPCIPGQDAPAKED